MRRTTSLSRLLTISLVAVVGALLAGATTSPASAATKWPAGCKVTSYSSAPYVTVASMCPSNRHQVVAWCAPNGGSTAYATYGNIASAGRTSSVQCTNSRLVRTDIVTAWRPRN